MEPIEIAKKLIRHEVERGDDIGFIRRGQQGVGCSEYSAHVHGDKIFVTRIKKKEVNISFQLNRIYQLIKMESVQPTLF